MINKWIKMSFVLAILNMVDALFTSYFVNNNLAVEMNPLLKHIVHITPLFMFIKILGSAAAIGLGLTYREKISRYALIFLLTVYSLVCLHHLSLFVFLLNGF